MILSRRKLWLLPALAALVVGAVTAGQAQAVPDDVVVNDVLNCDGGTQKRVFVRTDSNALTIAETGWTAIPGMQVNFVVPNDQTDHILVQFSADARLTNPNFSYTLPADEILVRILLDNVEMEPPLGDHTFNTDVGQSNALQACKRVGPGNHTITVEYQVVDPMPFVNLTGVLDGMALHVQQSE
ncbi:hypothetical protein [Allorhizocola rhizosphaerae]|uniref:hypothetical protein n=1 Tax=Allorhizocola rhizosphaerae TaxID=1872709 RepID=UPI000E3BF8B4|nr:hypothetical protein [Allorhizocola rhizosphaerae]